jgi:DNA-binding SARP family transcriptional activator
MTGTKMSSPPRDTERSRAPARLVLLGGFSLLLDGQEVLLPSNAQRVLAGLSVGQRTHLAQPRLVFAERLWSESLMERAQANLRTALWRIRQADPGLITTAHDRLQLGPSVNVDVHESLAQAKRLLCESDEPLAAEDSQVEPLVQDLLPGWDDDWLLLERERVRQIHLHALEALSTRLRMSGRFGRAIEAALAAVSAEPLRESAHNALIAAHLAEGNIAEAHRQYRRYEQILWDELRLSPLHTFEQLRMLYGAVSGAATRSGGVSRPGAK